MSLLKETKGGRERYRDRERGGRKRVSLLSLVVNVFQIHCYTNTYNKHHTIRTLYLKTKSSAKKTSYDN